MTLKRFFLISLAVHAALLYGALHLPKPSLDKKNPPMVSLISPDVLVHQTMPPKSRALRIPPPTYPAPSKEVPPQGRRLPRPEMEKPTGPGEDRLSGKSPAREVSPQTEKAGRTTEEGETRKPSTPRLRQPSGKGMLFDRQVTEEIAEKSSGNKDGAGKKDGPVTFDTKEYRFSGYMGRLRDKIESIWEYPRSAAEKGIYGDLKIRFVIKKDGRLASVELVRTSGYKILDDAALKALRDGEPYWPLPDEWGMDSYTVQGHFIYSIYGYGIR